MKAPRLRRICAHSGSSLGSNTTHCVPRSRLSSRKSARRRTGRYFHSEAWKIQRGVFAAREPPARAAETRGTGEVGDLIPGAERIDHVHRTALLAILCGGAARLCVPVAAAVARERRTAA